MSDDNNGHALCPMLGFPDEETLQGVEYKYYVCRPVTGHPEIVAAVWSNAFDWNSSDHRPLNVGLFKVDPNKRVSDQRLMIGDNSISNKMRVADALEAQLTINYLIQNLPTEVT